MTEQTLSHSKNLRKKLQKQEQRIFARLNAAQKAQAKALERYHRAEECLQKRMARVQLIEGRLTLVRQQIDDLKVNPAMPPVEIEIPTWAQFIPPSSAGEDTSSNTIESTNSAREARAAAEAVEENTRMAAERAAAAEALAQASSAHTREAHRQAQLAEEALGEIRVAIRNDLLTGEEAEHALQEAEREVTKSQASLADAEAAEEQALTAAMNAEAEAEVAEGMAYASVDRSTPLLEEAQEQDSLEEATGEIHQSYSAQEAVDNESGIIPKIPHVHTQEME